MEVARLHGDPRIDDAGVLLRVGTLHPTGWEKLGGDLVFSDLMPSMFFTEYSNGESRVLLRNGVPIGARSGSIILRSGLGTDPKTGLQLAIYRQRTWPRLLVFRAIPPITLVVRWGLQVTNEALHAIAYTMAGEILTTCDYEKDTQQISVTDLRTAAATGAICRNLLLSQNQQIEMIFDGDAYQSPENGLVWPREHPLAPSNIASLPHPQS